MTREEAIEWCETYLPQWPVGTMPLHMLARPLGWYWVQSLYLSNPIVSLKFEFGAPGISKDDIPKFKTISIPLDDHVKVLNREDAIDWIEGNLHHWPITTRLLSSPEGWRWVSKEVPYKDSEILLINNAGERIYRKMVTGF